MGFRGVKNRIWFTKFGKVATVPCHWCERPLRFREATCDHEPPLSEGGRKLDAVIACWDCNQRRNREMQKRKAGKP
jgi:hypothetical protein